MSTTEFKNHITKDSLSVMEELFHQANYKVSNLEAIHSADVYGWDVEIEIYPPGESYPYYLTVHYYLFSELLEDWYSANDIEKWLDVTKDDEGEPITPMWWYKEIASDKQKLEATNYIIKELFTLVF
jgi:hypothetical protein